MNVLTFDVGGTTIKYGLVSDKLEIISKDVFKVPKNENDFIKLINSVQENHYENFEKISYVLLYELLPKPTIIFSLIP